MSRILQHLTTMDFGYGLICIVISFTILGCAAFLTHINDDDEDDAKAFLYVCIPLILINGTGFACGLFYLYDFTFLGQQLIGYCFCCGLATLISVLYLGGVGKVLGPMFLAGMGGCSGLIVYGIIMTVFAAIACPVVWFGLAFFAVISVLCDEETWAILTGEGCDKGRFSYIVARIGILILMVILLFVPNHYLRRVDISPQYIINKYVIEKVVRHVHLHQRPEPVSGQLERTELVLRGNLNRETISTNTILGRSKQLQYIIDQSPICASMEFMLESEIEQNYAPGSSGNAPAYKTVWYIRSLHTGDGETTGVVLDSPITSRTRLTDEPVRLHSGDTIILTRRDRADISIQVTILPRTK